MMVYLLRMRGCPRSGAGMACITDIHVKCLCIENYQHCFADENC